MAFRNRGAPPVRRSDVHLVILHGTIEESLTGVGLVHLAVVLRSDRGEEAHLACLEHRRIQVQGGVVYPFNLLVPSYAHAYLALQEMSLSVTLVVAHSSGSKNLGSTRRTDHLESIPKDESLVLVEVCRVPLLAVDSRHCVLVAPRRLVEIYAGWDPRSVRRLVGDFRYHGRLLVEKVLKVLVLRSAGEGILLASDSENKLIRIRVILSGGIC